ncbi:hypothetical protein DIS24_g318 [Lasiodiplodia hormozganensis]|uniref:Uncharacterized protein n=1 Tax=Lasiodiplodia hormozganensis TaxID=869390 RepID=A0AA40D7Z9_9PEZI|nr:hypothetical protein DIS24_g318 [Lasiodiplodia hormozganensis]
MSLTAPYDNAMRLGQGFNTYTQEIRIENAVTIKPKAPVTTAKVAAPKPIKNGSLAVPPKDAPAIVTPPVTPPPANKAESKSEPSTPTSSPKRSADAQALSELPTMEALQDRGMPSPAASIMDMDDSVETAVFSLPDIDGAPPNQTVTYSTRAIDNVSDIMDALNISTAMSIKYGTIHGNASAGFVNENKVLDSQLNYIVSVKVNNENCLSSSHTHLHNGDMIFNPVEEMPPERFTDVYGDSFISGFLEGGEFSAVISIQVADRSRLRRVKQAVDLALAVGPSPVSIGAQESVDKDHSEVLQDTEITISVNWTGGGDIKKPEVPWTLNTVVAVANAFPSMVARSSSKTAAVLTRYESLRGFQAWKWKMEAKEKGWAERLQQLNYTPCSLYTAELFDALMAYKKLWKRIGGMLKDPSKWQARKPVVKVKALSDGHDILYESPTTARKASGSAPDSLATLATIALADIPERKHTFDIDDPHILEGRSLKELNMARDPIPVDPVALNEARLLCRQAMTLITEEAARLVSHPDLAYADFSIKTQRTKLKRPNYAYPEVLAARLPVPLRNDALPTAFPSSAAARLTQAFARGDELHCILVGDEPNPNRTIKPFTSLAMAPSSAAAATPIDGVIASTAPENATADDDALPQLARLSLHSYHHHALSLSSFSKGSSHAIGAIGFRFNNNSGSGPSYSSASSSSKKKAAAEEKEDGCTHHAGSPSFHTLSSSGAPSWRALELASHVGHPAVNVVRVDVFYAPRSHRIAGLAFWDEFAGKRVERLAWKQWEVDAAEEGGHAVGGGGAPGGQQQQLPQGMVCVKQEPPRDGARWAFVGLSGEWDESVWGSVLTRVGAVWRRVEEERGELEVEL